MYVIVQAQSRTSWFVQGVAPDRTPGAFSHIGSAGTACEQNGYDTSIRDEGEGTYLIPRVRYRETTNDPRSRWLANLRRSNPTEVRMWVDGDVGENAA